MPSVAHAAGAAVRWRQGRLRQFLRHERLTVAMVLSEKKHHTSRGQRTDRTGEGGIETNNTATIGETPLPEPDLFHLFEEEPGGERPEAFAEPRPQVQVQRHTVDHLADFAPMVQMLDVPEAQTVDQLEDVLTLFDTSVPEQVIEVPKISCPSRPLRAALAATQMTEQLVKVPTDVVLVVPRQLVEWFDIPVPGARGSSGNGGLQGFFPEQSFPHSSVEQIVDIPVPGGGLQDFLPDQASAASSAVLPEEPFQGEFSNFSPGEKGAKVTRQSSARVHGHSSSSELSAHQIARGGEALQGSVPGQFPQLFLEVFKAFSLDTAQHVG